MPVNCVSWSPKGDLIASGGDDNTVQIWSLSSNKPIIKYSNGSPVYSVAWSNDGKRVASAGDNGVVNVWEFNTGKNIYNYSGHTGIVWSPSRSGSYFLASAGDDSQVLIWNTSRFENNPVTPYNKHLGAVKSIAWSPDGNDIVSASADGTIHIWEAFTGNDIIIYDDFNYRRYSNLIVSVVSVAWSLDGKTIAYGHLEERVDYAPYSLVKVLDFCRSWCLFHNPKPAS